MSVLAITYTPTAAEINRVSDSSVTITAVFAVLILAVYGMSKDYSAHQKREPASVSELAARDLRVDGVVQQGVVQQGALRSTPVPAKSSSMLAQNNATSTDVSAVQPTEQSYHDNAIASPTIVTTLPQDPPQFYSTGDVAVGGASGAQGGFLNSGGGVSDVISQGYIPRDQQHNVVVPPPPPGR